MARTVMDEEPPDETPPPRGGMVIWTVYDHPSDYPNVFVARRWLVDKTLIPTTDVIINQNVDQLRNQLRRLNLVKLTRSPGDDPKIVESWF